MTTMPGDAEAHAAVAALNDQTVSHRQYRQGMRVRCPLAFGCGTQDGTVFSEEQDRHLGTVYLVDTDEGRLLMLPDELEFIGWPF